MWNATTQMAYALQNISTDQQFLCGLLTFFQKTLRIRLNLTSFCDIDGARGIEQLCCNGYYSCLLSCVYQKASVQCTQGTRRNKHGKQIKCDHNAPKWTFESYTQIQHVKFFLSVPLCIYVCHLSITLIACRWGDVM